MKNKAFILFSLLIGVFTACPALSEPAPETSETKAVWLEQGWSAEDRHWYHHASQGSLTVPVPVEWFMALEQPVLFEKWSDILKLKADWKFIKKLFFEQSPLLSDTAYLADLGFIPSEKSETDNPYGLPVGFAVDAEAWQQAGHDGNYKALGFTCAACHTGHMQYNDVHIRYDGGAATVNLIAFNVKLYIAVIETWLSTERFTRFAKLVLQDNYSEETSKALRVALTRYVDDIIHSAIQTLEQEVEKVSKNAAEAIALLKKAAARFDKLLSDLEKGKKLAALWDIYKLRQQGKEIYKLFITYKKEAAAFLNSFQEGYARLDALNRIGNTVFADDAKKLNNKRPTDAPVNYPFIWTTSWFNWVQYDGSIMQPMVRNAGEALGTNAYLNFSLADPAKHFDSSVRIHNLHEMETQLAGKEPPFAQKSFGGLQAPQWPEDLLGKIDREKAEQGGKLYTELCQHCHLPPLNSDAIWDKKYWVNAKMYGGGPDAPDLELLKLKVYPLDKIGTDPSQAEILPNRKVDITGLGIKTKIYNQEKSGQPCKTLPVDGKEQSEQLFAFALGAVVQEAVNFQYDKQKIPSDQREKMNGNRINCLRALKGYRVRPLNGIWATPPFLHNGSVPTLYDLLSPVAERPKVFYLGHLAFDPEKIGYLSTEAKGLSKVDTSKLGSLNTGHEFNNGEGKGIIGRLLTEEERFALIEYLKTL